MLTQINGNNKIIIIFYYVISITLRQNKNGFSHVVMNFFKLIFLKHFIVYYLVFNFSKIAQTIWVNTRFIKQIYIIKVKVIFYYLGWKKIIFTFFKIQYPQLNWRKNGNFFKTWYVLRKFCRYWRKGVDWHLAIM